MTEDRSRLAGEQRDGIDDARYHEILSRISPPRPR